ncbi:MAG: glycine cleavage system protein GcvH [Planctomycetota bacterium]|jgi:glycine cleavage system H protein|nr:glycine cleavage system protein GcvH [Planctomycetota bacterium]MDP6761727.1 glycine cleavage system protein GcvH [Planctomycetota bacterium]MDP6988400.1 glycine cleavage system protein GcvH [Planctomycetota bacterium]
MRPDDRKYLETHEWAKVSGDTALIGLTDFAIHELCSGNEGDLVYCDLPETGRTLEVGETFGEIESVKAVADLNSPVEGEVIEVNEAIEDHLEILSSDPWEQGWMIKVKLTQKSVDHLIDAEAYESMLAEQS